jgi:2'-5' RNA ligase
MHRLFVAIRPPDAIRSLLIGIMGGVSGARWQTDDQLHLTLRFIGEVNRHTADDVVAALGGVHHPRFQLSIGGLGTFGRRGQADVIWAGVTPQDHLKSLHNKVDQALARVGLPPEHRAFHPHITLARLGRSAGPVGNFLADAGGLTSPAFAVDAFSLYESTLTPESAVYREAERYPLD